MRKSFVWALIAAIVIIGSSTSCASSNSSAEAETLVEIGRVIARSFLYVELQNRGVSPEDAQKTLDALKAIVDQVLAGKSVYAVLYDSAWPQVRAELKADITATLVAVKRGDVHVFDQATAEFITEQAIALVESRAKKSIGK